MLETHPFSTFAPSNAKYLILGSFAGKEAVKGKPYYDPLYDWYYGTKRNQFWPILEAVYDVQLTNRTSKEKLFENLGIAIADIIYQCEREEGSNMDLFYLPSPSPRNARMTIDQKIRKYKELLPQKF